MFTLAKRVVLFFVVNILIMTTISIAWMVFSQIFHVPPGTYYFLIFYCVIFGFGGALVSLALSRVMAKWMMGVQVIDPNTSSPRERELVDRVHRLAQAAGLPTLPEVGIYESQEINAFATGPSRSRSLVAVSTGLLQRMGPQQIDGVLGHEVGHIANGDMVTMTLIQGAINSVVMIFARLIAMAVSSQVEERNRYWIEFALIMILQIVLSLLGAIVVNYFSRRREFRADFWGARLAGKQNMISALRALAGTEPLLDTEDTAHATLKISGRSQNVMMHLLATHPSLDERIAALNAI
jgi:heat shock protein HtpX